MPIGPIIHASSLMSECTTDTKTATKFQVVKILHILRDLSVGGLENWLLQVTRTLDKRRFQLDFLVHSPKKGSLEDQFVSHSRVFRLPHLHNPLYYGREFQNLLEAHGPYQAIHSHMALGGFQLRWAHKAKIPIRISHSHSNEAKRARKLSKMRQITHKLSRHLIRRHATLGLAVTPVAAYGRFGPRWQEDHHFHIMPCGIPLNSYVGKLDRSKIRRELGLPESAFVLGHVGRFVWEKNHSFLIDVLASLFHIIPETHLLFIGDGPLRPELEQQARLQNLSDRIVFAGFRSDIPDLLRGAVDFFLFPSQHEAAPVAVLEAQAAGLPCLIADTIPDTVIVVPDLVQQLPLQVGAQGWAEKTKALKNNASALTSVAALRRMQGTLFDIETNVQRLETIYATGQWTEKVKK